MIPPAVLPNSRIANEADLTEPTVVNAEKLKLDTIHVLGRYLGTEEKKPVLFVQQWYIKSFNSLGLSNRLYLSTV